MKTTQDLRALVAQSLSRFASIAEADWSHKPAPEKWSRREILGHLIDSAHNNLRRFTVTQYREGDKIVYWQDDWVRIQQYQQMSTEEVIALWRIMNEQVARVMEAMPLEKYAALCDTGKQNSEMHSLEFLMSDYVVHQIHHLGKI